MNWDIFVTLVTAGNYQSRSTNFIQLPHEMRLKAATQATALKNIHNQKQRAMQAIQIKYRLKTIEINS